MLIGVASHTDISPPPGHRPGRIFPCQNLESKLHSPLIANALVAGEGGKQGRRHCLRPNHNEGAERAGTPNRGRQERPGRREHYGLRHSHSHRVGAARGQAPSAQ